MKIFPLIAVLVALAGCLPVSSGGVVSANPPNVVHPDFR